MRGRDKPDLKNEADDGSDFKNEYGLQNESDLSLEERPARGEPRGEDWRSGAGRRSRVHPWWNTVLFPVISAVLVFHFQNCTPQGEGEVALERDPAADSSHSVTVIDPVNLNTAVSFNSKRVDLHSDVEAVVLTGQCSSEQEGSVLGWNVLDEVSGQEERAQGFSKCEGGEFKIELAPTQELVCGQVYRVRARLGLGEAGETALSRRCAPEAITEIAVTSMKPQLQNEEGALCQLERRHEDKSGGVTDTDNNTGTGCSVVCYSAEGVVETERPLDASNCEI